MLRIPKWKIEKTKVKVVFCLQFHATHISREIVVNLVAIFRFLFIRNLGWDKLFISLIPIDVGRTTAKTNKVNVRNGSCKWPDPIYETTRLLQDAKTKTYDEKLYKLLVATVTVQLLTSKTGFREFEQQRELSVRGIQMISSNKNYPVDTEVASPEIVNEVADKVEFCILSSIIVGSL
ncbi:hypothetical protein ZIOFF_045094 [Zingiber officinale]|uniref:C2 NT-type domain-containing protein n=1 Tax=Zingiber officinale TaxID=94328 RepID=A0A8J5G385_ZINOF|nr:hypothetical protein ZIOFF_045094 [Zingiber officinale]